ncbi:Bdr family repetitive protein (plasmid) [Borrelia miyamotoi]|uniref:Bdr family repetitive protein n=3 Tax=Borrelia miyamotoi TaxID=47466 RepID=A0AAQ3HF70_9SPIR|nr:Bdr family repetitive protein [Borrelia miyamotoi]AHH05873.1 BDR-repeat family protein [Borrelia miyamotoi FR64b]ATQ15504.1 Bdr family repetitive protein [Borrelia miyamotoi]ATQ16593.1 Bdr family repetitive protein [Borrelia miyamotoi]ATQ17766.1 Bdr family repetitive protein [Borrelia miyamotoi]ATQ18986.1 Bdr family repetitive protein [Borrelia miyamotoi]
MGLPQPVITRQMVLTELIKAGIKQEIAEDLSYRYYKNELTHKDIEYLKENFDIKLEKVEASLKAEIRDLDNKIDNVRNELKSDIRELDNKIDNKFNELDNKIDKVENNLNNKIEKIEAGLKSNIASVSNEVALVRKDMKINRTELDSKINTLDSKIDKVTSEIKGTLKLHGWMFGTIITLNVGIFLTLTSIVYSLLNK